MPVLRIVEIRCTVYSGLATLLSDRVPPGWRRARDDRGEQAVRTRKVVVSPRSRYEVILMSSSLRWRLRGRLRTA